MNLIQEEQLKIEIAHIFESGANEIRILEMVKSFFDKNIEFYEKRGYEEGMKDAHNSFQDEVSHRGWK
jgi:hypothetical protein